MEVTTSSIVSTYRDSWLRLSEEQQRMVCRRFGIDFTTGSDSAMIAKVEMKQQQEYDNLKLRMEHLRDIKPIFRVKEAFTKKFDKGLE